MWMARLAGPGVLMRVRGDPPPAPGAGQAIVAIRYGGICGSDLPYFRDGGREGAGAAPPGFPLHEIVGTVRDPGDTGLLPGAPVVGWASRSDALAELVRTDTAGLATLPPGMSSEPATVAAQPLACVRYAIDQLGPVRGRSAAVLGLGPIGLLFAWALRRLGASHVTGVDPVDRTPLATAFGLDDVVVSGSSAWAAGLGGNRPDIVIEAVGHQSTTLTDAITAVADHGTVYCFGIPLTRPYPVDLTAVVRRNLRVLGGITHDRAYWLGAALADLADNPALGRELVTHVLPAADPQRAFTAACAPKPGQLKIVLDFARLPE
ncbi:zinc-binding dehydrogenase [Saccharomonospora sp. NPDC006951]